MMDRRTFVWGSLGGAASTFLPLLSCTSQTSAVPVPSGDPKLPGKLSPPHSLSLIHDATTLRELGEKYRQLVPRENRESRLVDLLLTNVQGERVARSSDSLFLQDLLKEQIEYDVMTGNTVVIQGWVLSITEARQCALFSLTQS